MGKISLSINTDGYGGHKVTENILVRTNDPDKPNHKIKVFGDVESFATVSPGFVRLDGPVGKELEVPVRIIPRRKYPFDIVGKVLLRGKYVSLELREADASDGGGYILTVKNLRKKRGRYLDLITLKTTSKIRPDIQIKVYGNILPVEPKKPRP